MKKIKIILSLIISFAFLFIVFGLLFVLIGALNNNYNFVYVGIGLIITSTICYTILIIYGIIYYFKRRK